MPYVTDTHPIVWYFTEDPRLSPQAKGAFDRAENGEDVVVVPCIVFLELLYLTEKRRVPVELSGLMSAVSSSRNYQVQPLCEPIIEKCGMIPREQVPNPGDRIIAATSLHRGCPLISKDKSFERIGLNIVW